METDETKAADVNRLVRRAEPTDESEDVSGSIGDDAVSTTANRDPALLDGVRRADEHIDVERALANIKNFRKRLAFRLFMDDVPFKSKKTDSIAQTVSTID
jgi:hypothetical protein